MNPRFGGDSSASVDCSFSSSGENPRRVGEKQDQRFVHLIDMGGSIVQNDTLQITCEQGFPEVLDLEVHLKTPYRTQDFEGQVFAFQNKPGIRNYQAPPVRNFLVENREGKWIYWGLVHVLQVVHDYEQKLTSGKFRIVYLYTPEEMRKAHELIDRNPETQYFV